VQKRFKGLDWLKAEVLRDVYKHKLQTEEDYDEE